MRFIPKYRVGYNGKFYEAGAEFTIRAADAEEMKKHGAVLEEPALSPAPKRTGRPRKNQHEQS